MSRDPSEIRLEIEETRDQLTHSLTALRDSVAEATDWRLWVRRNKLAFAAGAFVLGAAVGFR